MNKAVGEAPGKILLIGEHSVVYGHPAIAMPLRSVCARAEVELTRNGHLEFNALDLSEIATSDENASSKIAPLFRLARSVLNAFGEQKQGVRINLHSTIPMGRGMGSGAAAAVAVVKGICNVLGRSINADQVTEFALEAEKEFHGTPSGVDCAVVTQDIPIYFVRGKPSAQISVGAQSFRFLVADTGIESPTIRVVQDVKVARERDRALYDSYFWELGSMASVAREIIRGGVPGELGACMTHAHGVLQSLGVSCSELDRLVEVALEKGALGAKLSGAGRGGAMIALIDDDTDEDRLSTELRLAGAENVFTTVLSAPTKK